MKKENDVTDERIGHLVVTEDLEIIPQQLKREPKTESEGSKHPERAFSPVSGSNVQNSEKQTCQQADRLDEIADCS